MQRNESIYIYPPKVAVFEHKKTDVGIYPYISNATLFVYTQLLYSYFYRHLHFFIDAFQKVYHSPTGSGLDKIVYLTVAMFEMKESYLMTGDMMVIQF